MGPEAFLEALSLGQYVAAFVDNGVDESNLSSLTDDDLKELGVAALMHRKKILAALAAMTPATAGPAPTTPTTPNSSPADALPTLLALPLRELEHEPSPVVALWAACDVVELTLKLVVMAGVAEHTTAGGALPAALVRELRDRVELPTLGKWLGMAQAVARHARADSTLPLASTVASLEALLGGKDATIDNGLLALRNRLAHGGPLFRAEAQRLLSLWQPRVLAWAGTALSWLQQARLVVVDGEGRRFVLRGPEGHEAAGDDGVPVDATAGSAWLSVGGRALALGPLGAFDVGDRSLQVYVRRGEVRLQYLRLGDSGGICDSEPSALERFRAIFLPAESTPTTGKARFTIRDFNDDLKKEADRRVGRDAELVTLTAALRDLNDGVVWLAGPAGIGKSNLMAAAILDVLQSPPEGALVLPRGGSDPEHWVGAA